MIQYMFCTVEDEFIFYTMYRYACHRCEASRYRKTQHIFRWWFLVTIENRLLYYFSQLGWYWRAFVLVRWNGIRQDCKVWKGHLSSAEDKQISMAKKDVIPVRYQWSYVFLALTHRYVAPPMPTSFMLPHFNANYSSGFNSFQTFDDYSFTIQSMPSFFPNTYFYVRISHD